MSTNYFTPASFGDRKRQSGTGFSPTTPSFTPAPTPNGIPMRAGARAREDELRRRGSTLSSKYQPARTSAIAGARAGLEGMGGYKVGDDGKIDFDPNARPGERQKQGIRGELDAVNARGIMDSSFAVKNVGMAMARLSAEAQAVVNQHASTMNQLVMQEAAEYDEINANLTQLYGEEAQWAIDNPPPPPAPPPKSAAEIAWEGRRDADAAQQAAAPERKVLALPNSKNWTPGQLDRWHRAHPNWNLKKRGDGSWVAVKEH